MSALALGQSFGRVPQQWSAESLALSVVVHDCKRANALHTHEAAFVTLMLDGQYSETDGRRSIDFQRFTAVYHPSELEHRDSIGALGVRLLMLEFRPELLDGIAVDRTRLRAVRDVSGSRAAWQMLSFYDDGERDPLQFESRAFEVLASIATAARTPRDLPSLERARAFVHAHVRERMTMRDVASAANVHAVHLGQSFRREYGETVGTYVMRLRVRQAAEALTTSTTPIATIASEYGFCDQSHFNRVFKRLAGSTPAEFRRTWSVLPPRER